MTDSGYFQHPQALVESGSIGEKTRIWAFAHILPGAKVGAGCNICDHVFIENDVVIGDRVTIKCGVQLWDGLTIEDDVFVGPNATFTNDPFPQSRNPPRQFLRTVLKKGASIGANATILPGLTIGPGAMIGAGAVVVGNVPAYTIVVGNPARIIGYVGSTPSAMLADIPQEEGRHASRVAGVALHRLPMIEDVRGHLSFGEVQRHIPFEIRRYFLVFGVSGEHVRGEHAHRTLHQFLICVHGRCHIVADDGVNREEFILSNPYTGVHIPPMVWSMQYRFSADAVLMVLASEFYDPADYIRDHAEFLSLVRQ